MNEFDVSSKEMETLTQDYAITYNDLVSKLFLSDNIIENNIIKGNRFTNFIKNLSSKYAFGFSNKGREGEVEFNKRTIRSVMDALKEASKASEALTKAVNAFNIFDESNSEYNTIKKIIEVAQKENPNAEKINRTISHTQGYFTEAIAFMAFSDAKYNIRLTGGEGKKADLTIMTKFNESTKIGSLGFSLKSNFTDKPASSFSAHKGVLPLAGPREIYIINKIKNHITQQEHAEAREKQEKYDQKKKPEDPPKTFTATDLLTRKIIGTMYSDLLIGGTYPSRALVLLTIDKTTEGAIKIKTQFLNDYFKDLALKGRPMRVDLYDSEGIKSLTEKQIPQFGTKFGFSIEQSTAPIPTEEKTTLGQ
jgi:hypothetical protein